MYEKKPSNKLIIISLCIVIFIILVMVVVSYLPTIANKSLRFALASSIQKLSSNEPNSSKDYYSPINSIEPSFMERRTALKTSLSQGDKSVFEYDPNWEEEYNEYEGIKIVTYPSGDLQLKAGLYIPPEKKEGPLPALVYCHGGFSLGFGDMDVCYHFINAGYIVMVPTLRGENGQKGSNEILLGEVDDAANAVRWLARQPEVDSTRIYAFGHSVGGGVTAMLSLIPDLPLKHTGSCGGLYLAETFQLWAEDGIICFNPLDLKECQARILIGNVKWMQRPHYAYVGKDDFVIKEAVPILRAETKQEGKEKLFQCQEIPGDHFDCLEEALSRYISKIQNE